MVKVVERGEETLITGIRLCDFDTSPNSTLMCEWSTVGEWSRPETIFPDEMIVGIRGFFGSSDNIKSLGFVLLSYKA